jgi:hypothetical protein
VGLSEASACKLATDSEHDTGLSHTECIYEVRTLRATFAGHGHDEYKSVFVLQGEMHSNDALFVRLIDSGV